MELSNAINSNIKQKVKNVQMLSALEAGIKVTGRNLSIARCGYSCSARFSHLLHVNHLNACDCDIHWLNPSKTIKKLVRVSKSKEINYIPTVCPCIHMGVRVHICM